MFIVVCCNKAHIYIIEISYYLEQVHNMNIMKQ